MQAVRSSAQESQPSPARSEWQAADPVKIKSDLDDYFATQSLAKETQQQIDRLWAGNAISSDDELLNTVASSLALADPDAADLVATCRNQRRPLTLESHAILTDDARPAVVRANLALLYGRWLANHQLYDEANQYLADLTIDSVADPATLLFYQGVALYRLRNQDQGVATLQRLLKNEAAIPLRYAEVAKLMLADLDQLKEDSLDEVAKIMDSIRVRLGHGRVGTRVREEEDAVIKKLDKMIEELEKQRQQSQSQASNSGGTPTQPMQDSKAAGGTGPGDVAPKQFDDDVQWGDLPAKEREEALQQLGEDFPSHYREVIEEYFRKLAREEQEE